MPRLAHHTMRNSGTAPLPPASTGFSNGKAFWPPGQVAGVDQESDLADASFRCRERQRPDLPDTPEYADRRRRRRTGPPRSMGRPAPMSAVIPATAERFRLAEGPVWDAARECLVRVDILAVSPDEVRPLTSRPPRTAATGRGGPRRGPGCAGAAEAAAPLASGRRISRSSSVLGVSPQLLPVAQYFWAQGVRGKKWPCRSRASVTPSVTRSTVSPGSNRTRLIRAGPAPVSSARPSGGFSSWGRRRTPRGPRTLCDPRLNMRQAVAVAAHWQQGLSPARPAVRAANP